MPRMLRAALRGDYHGLTRGKVAMFGAALAYIVSPIDAIPEFLLGIGGGWTISGCSSGW